MNEFLSAFLVGGCLLLSFLLYSFPLQQNSKANKWLAFFVFILAMASAGNYLEKRQLIEDYGYIFKIINSLQFLLAPCIYISILYFVNPTNNFKIRYWLHFLPFFVFTVLENFIFISEKTISTKLLFRIGNFEVWVRDLLPFLLLGYVILGYLTLKKHIKNLEFITSDLQKTDLRWLKRFLVFLIVPLVFWINDSLSIFPYPFLLELTGYVYIGSIFFLAFNALRQGVIFPFEKKYLNEISHLLQTEELQPKIISDVAEVKTNNRLDDEEIKTLSTRLNHLLENEKIYLENELNLPTVAEKLGVSIHDTSFLINKIANENFYNFINRYRVEEAKRLLTSAKGENLNMLGIAFESGFNSKTAFNTSFKKNVGLSPSEYAKKKREVNKNDVRLDKSEHSQQNQSV